jgi:ketopantoate reductase
VSNEVLDVDRFSVSSNTKDLKSVIRAVNEVIRTETLAIANQNGIESPAIPQYTVGELFQRYNYRCRKIRSNWFQHTFIMKTGAKI